MGSPNVIDGVQINIIGNATPFAQAMDKAAAIARTQGKQIKDALNKEITESNHSLSLFGEAFGVSIPRHIRTFVSTLPGVGAAMSAAFNAVAVLVLIDVLVKAAEKVKQIAEAFKAAQDAPAKMREEAEKLNRPLQENNNELALTLIHTKNALALLQGKPENKLAEALAEAAVEADKLCSSLGKSIDGYLTLLKAQDRNAFMQVITGTTGTKPLQEVLQYVRAEEAKLPHDAAYDGRYKAILEEGHRRAEANRMVADVSNPFNAQFNQDKVAGNNSAVDIVETQLSNMHRSIDYTEQTKAAQGGLDKQTASNAAGAAADAAALAAHRKADQERAKQVADQRKRFEENLEFTASGHKRLLGEQLQFINSINALAENRDALSKKRNEVWAKMTADDSKVGIGGGVFANFDKVKPTTPADTAKTAEELAKLNREAAKTQSEENIKGIDWAEKTGQLSHYAAAMALAAEHAKEFRAQLGGLKYEHDQILMDGMTGALTPGERDIRLKKNENAQAGLRGANGLQIHEDAYNAQTQTASAGLRSFFTEFERDADNAANAVHSALTTAINGVNAELTNALMGKKTNWSKAFEQTGSGMIQSGLKAGESGIMKAFGFGKQQHVVVDNLPAGGLGGASTIASSVGSGLAGFVGKLGKFFGGFFADGGSPDPYKTSIVGENGPELFTPKVAGHVTSNKDSFGPGTGGRTTRNTYYIDATGTNAAEVDMRVQQGMLIAHNQAVQSTMKARVERSRRTPGGRG